MATTFQRCSDNRSMGDQMGQEKVEFGAMDEPEAKATPRQIRGAALAGSVAGAIIGGPVVAATVAAGAAFAAAKRESKVGNAARRAGDVSSDICVKTKKAIKGSFKKESKDPLESEVRRREAQMRNERARAQKQQRENPSVFQKIKAKHKNVMEARNRDKTLRLENSAFGRRNSFQEATGRPEPVNRLLTAPPSPSSKDEVEDSLDQYMASQLCFAPMPKGIRRNGSGKAPLPKGAVRNGSGKAPSSSNSSQNGSGKAPLPSNSSRNGSGKKHLGRNKAESKDEPRGRMSWRERRRKAKEGEKQKSSRSIKKAASQTLGKHEKDMHAKDSLVYRIAKQTVQPYSLNRDEMRSLTHGVASGVLDKLSHLPPVEAITSSSLAASVKNNWITGREMTFIASHISREVEHACCIVGDAVSSNKTFQETALSQSDVTKLAQRIVQEIMAAVSNCKTIQQTKLSADQMKSLASFMKGQARELSSQNQVVGAIVMSAQELKSLACFLKEKAHEALADEVGQAIAADSKKRNTVSGYNAKKSVTEYSQIAYELDGLISSLEKGAGSKPGSHLYRSEAYETKEDYSDGYDSEEEGAYSDRSESDVESYVYGILGDCDSEDSDEVSERHNDYSHREEDCDDRSYDSRGSYDSRDGGGSQGSYDSRDDDRSRGSYDSRAEGSDYHSYCSDHHEGTDGAEGAATNEDSEFAPRNDGMYSLSDDDFEDAVEKDEEKEEKDATGRQFEELKEARELALQILERMLLS